MSFIFFETRVKVIRQQLLSRVVFPDRQLVALAIIPDNSFSTILLDYRDDVFDQGNQSSDICVVSFLPHLDFLRNVFDIRTGKQTTVVIGTDKCELAEDPMER
jgi:hypothetical protein